MADSIGIAVMGASGRMGRMLIDTISGTDRAHLIAVTEREGHDWIGCDLGEALGRGRMGVPVYRRSARRDREGAGGDRLHHARGDAGPCAADGAGALRACHRDDRVQR
jgi:hypothetical protein